MVLYATYIALCVIAALLFILVRRLREFQKEWWPLAEAAFTNFAAEQILAKRLRDAEDTIDLIISHDAADQIKFSLQYQGDDTWYATFTMNGEQFVHKSNSPLLSLNHAVNEIRKRLLLDPTILARVVMKAMEDDDDE